MSYHSGYVPPIGVANSKVAGLSKILRVGWTGRRLPGISPCQCLPGRLFTCSAEANRPEPPKVTPDLWIERTRIRGADTKVKAISAVKNPGNALRTFPTEKRPTPRKTKARGNITCLVK